MISWNGPDLLFLAGYRISGWIIQHCGISGQTLIISEQNCIRCNSPKYKRFSFSIYHNALKMMHVLLCIEVKIILKCEILHNSTYSLSEWTAAYYLIPTPLISFHTALHYIQASFRMKKLFFSSLCLSIEIHL